jgi:predicted O-methyltransferase YrrM
VIRDRVRYRLALRDLPPAVRRFHAQARRRAREVGDDFSLASASPPADVARILRLARGAREVVEVGTGTAWTTIALALDHDDRRVVSYDPIAWEHRPRYLELVPADVRERIELVEGFGEPGAGGRTEPVDFLFIDSSHDRAETVATFRAWEPHLAPGAVVAFHDYGHPDYPGVAEAIVELGLDGGADDEIYVWRAPATS